MADPLFRVTFHGVLNDEAKRALSEIEAHFKSAHGRVTGRELENQTYTVAAPDEATAVAKVREALEGHGGFGDFRARTVE